jgi:hypothetical protein
VIKRYEDVDPRSTQLPIPTLSDRSSKRSRIVQTLGRERLNSHAVVAAQHTAEPVALRGDAILTVGLIDRLQQTIFEPLMIAFAMIMRNVFANSTAQSVLPHEDHAFEVFLLDRVHEALGISVVLRLEMQVVLSIEQLSSR